MRKELFHYCSNEKCFSILSNGTIRLSDIQKSNDYKELSLFFPDIFEYMEELYRQKPFRFKYDGKKGEEAFVNLLHSSYDYWNKNFSTGAFSNFVLCLSEDADSLSQWRGYANNGKGCCLGFSGELLQEYCMSTNGVLRIEQVTYLEDLGIERVIHRTAQGILSELKGLRKWIVNEMTYDDNNTDTDALLHYNFDGMLEAAFIDSLQYKAYTFHEEREWRIFLKKPAYKEPKWICSPLKEELRGPKGFAETINYLNNRIEFHATDHDLIPYCPIQFDEFTGNPISSICIGPKSHIRTSDLELFLKQKGYQDTEIRKSRITYC